MGEREALKQRIETAAGSRKPQLVLKSARVLNVFTEELEEVDVAISDGYIVGLGTYEGEREVSLPGMIICPGFLDGHIHLESSMVAPKEFEQAVLPHGTTGVITDPHEIANVAGTEGIDYMLETTKDLNLDVYFMLPSCVPATGLDESGAVLLAEQLASYYQRDRVLGLAELMNAYGTVAGDEDILDKVADARKNQKIIDGHAPGISGRQLNAYVTAGVRSDHECSTAGEAMEKLRRGQWIMIREGTAAKNLQALMPLCKAPYADRCMFVTDDKHPGDLMTSGHIDGIIRRAVELGADPIKAVKMGSCHAARYFGLKEQGAVAPGYRADLVVLSDLKTVTVHQVYKDGRLVAEDGRVVAEDSDAGAGSRTASGSFQCDGSGNFALDHHEDLEKRYPRVYRSFQMRKVRESDFQIEPKGSRIRAICLTPHELLTTEQEFAWTVQEGYAPGVDVSKDLIKMAVLERHHGTGHIGLGFLHGYGLSAGAVATSVAHDSHNLIVAGVTDADMTLAANTVRRHRGGLAVVKDGKVLGVLPLPIAGLMTPEPAGDVDRELERLKSLTRELGIPETIDPFMTLAFASLPVIPKLRLNTYGLIDVEKQSVTDVTC
ncbi:MAG: adenine deaminase [Eubacteriales bacterium]|nr:adenine deaminase [Eubacteriales bacterium]